MYGHAAKDVTIQVSDSSPRVLDKSALYYGSSRFLLLRAWQPQAAMPAAKNLLRTTVECRFIDHVW